MTTAAEDEIRSRVRGRLSLIRWRHTLGVAETADSLAAKYGADLQHARIASLLHDYARERPPEELLRLAGAYGLAIDPIEAREPLLLHGAVGAALAREELGVAEPDILAAIASHITGMPGMSLLQRIIFLADFMEPGRTFAASREAREAAREDLARAMLIAFDAIIAHVVSSGYMLHPRTVAARNELSIGR